MDNDDIDENISEAVYQGTIRDLDIEEEILFNGFDLERQTAQALKRIENALRSMQHDGVNKLSHAKRNAICDDVIDMVVELRRFYDDTYYDGR